ncbi:MAG: dockerin type I repeat-containing protein, partial [Candidatus Zixiibacteriota bacterium]
TGMGLEWGTRIVVPHGDQGIDITVVRTGPQAQRFPGGSRLLHATVTFALDDTTTMCVDTCFYQPTERLAFSRSDAVTYIPRDNMPYCVSIRDQGCPGQDPNDNGDCDSLIVEVYPPDRSKASFPAQVRFPIRITNDIPNPAIDSITGMTLILGYSSSNPTTNAWLDPDYNKCGAQDLHPFSDLSNSIFRHLPSMESPQERNWMMDLSEQGTGLEWDTRILGIDLEDKIFCAFIPTGSQDQRFCGGSGVLLATLSFTLEDTTTICIDTGWFPVSRHAFSRADAVTYIPRDNMPYCTSIELSVHGDATGDGVINIADVMYMINYLYRSGPYPASFEAGDANCDGDHGILDVVILINFLYKGGRHPGCI